MEVCFLASGEKLTVLAPDEFEGKSTKAVKQVLAAKIDVTIFRQRLFSEDGSEIPDDEIFASTPGKLMILILDFFHTDAEQTQRMISASINNDVIELKSLVKKPLNPNVRDENGTTPLHCAAERGHVESLLLLIEAGAEKNAQDQGRDGKTPLHVAAVSGQLDVVRHLVEVGADKDQQTVDGSTPFLIAACQGHLEVVRHLVEVGAHKDQAANDGATPLFIAAGNDNLDVVRHLVEVGALKDQAANDYDGATHCTSQHSKAILTSFVIWSKSVPTKIKPRTMAQPPCSSQHM